MNSRYPFLVPTFGTLILEFSANVKNRSVIIRTFVHILIHKLHLHSWTVYSDSWRSSSGTLIHWIRFDQCWKIKSIATNPGMFYWLLITQYLVFQQHAKFALQPGDDGILSDSSALQPGGATMWIWQTMFKPVTIVQHNSCYENSTMITTLLIIRSCSWVFAIYYYGYEHLVLAFTPLTTPWVFHGVPQTCQNIWT